MIFSIAVSNIINSQAPVPLTGRLEEQIKQASVFGFDGVEIHTPSAELIDVQSIRRICKENGIVVTTIGTGSIFGKFNLSITDSDEVRRDVLVKMLQKYIDVAADLGSKVTIGSLKGNLSEDRRLSLQNARKVLCLLNRYAEEKGVLLLLEATNRYENNYFNRGEEIYSFIKENSLENIRILMDSFHMNIEESSPFTCLYGIKEYLGHIHIADNNRMYAGAGYFDFRSLIDEIKGIGYDGVVSVECLPYPTGGEAALRSIEFFKSHFS